MQLKLCREKQLEWENLSAKLASRERVKHPPISAASIKTAEQMLGLCK